MLLLSSCAGEFNKVYKYGDDSYKYEYAKEAFANNKFQQATVLLEELVTMKKASDEAQECLSRVHWKDLVWENGTVEDTQYSNVYDQTGIALYLRNWNDYGKTCRFSL